MNQKQDRERVSGRRRAEEHKSGGTYYLAIPEEASVFKNDRKGARYIDILPYRVTKGSDVPGGNPNSKTGKLYFERTFFVHARIGADESSYVCPAKTANQRCPICEARAKMAKDSSADPEMVKALLPKERQLWNVIDLEDKEKGVQIWDVSYHLFGKRLDKEVKLSDEDQGYEWFADLEEGSSLKLGVDEKSLPNSKYLEVETIHFKRRAAYDPTTLSKVFDLDTLLTIHSYEKLKQIFLQGEEDASPDTDTAAASIDADGWDSPKETKSAKEETKPTKEESVKEETKQANSTPRPNTAAEFGLSVGMRVMHKEFGKCEIVHISSDGTSLRLEDVQEGLHKGVAVDEVRPIGSSETKTEAKTETKTEKAEVKADDDWDSKPSVKTEPKKETKKKTTKAGAKDGDDWDNW